MDNMNHWFTYTIMVMLFWGMCGFFSKLAATSIRPVDVYIYQVVGTLLGAIVVAFLVKYQPASRSVGIVYAIAAGVLMTVGAFFHCTRPQHRGSHVYSALPTGDLTARLFIPPRAPEYQTASWYRAGFGRHRYALRMKDNQSLRMALSRSILDNKSRRFLRAPRFKQAI